MKKVFIIAMREWGHFFQTPFAMVVLTIFLVICGTYFNTALESYMAIVNPADTTVKIRGANVNLHLVLPFFKDVLNLLLFIIPLITMRCFAEEKKLGTYDLLISYPIKPWELLLGKYIGIASLILTLLAMSSVYLVAVFLRSEPYLPQIYTTYLGYALFLLFYTAVGVVASLATENQIVAAIFTYLILLGAAIVQWAAFIMPAPWDRLFAHFLVLAQLESFRGGIIFLGDIVGYLSFTILLLVVGELKIRRHFAR